MSHSAPTTLKSRFLQIIAGLLAFGALVALGFLASAPVDVPASFDPGSFAATAASHTPGPPAVSTVASDTALVAQQATPTLQQYCSDPTAEYGDSPSYLPALRWTDFGLASVPGKMFGISLGWSPMSAAAEILFYLSSLLWTILIQFLEFGLNFKPLCYTAPAINSMLAVIGRYMGFFLVPIAIYAMWAGRKHIFGGNVGKGLAGLAAIALAFGASFYITERAEVAEQTAGSDSSAIIQTTGTMPWVLANITNVFSGINTSITGTLGDLSETAAGAIATRQADAHPAFYDGLGDEGRNDLTCAAFDEGLIELYKAQGAGGIANPAGMVTMNELWERAFLANWISAQMGTGSAGTNEYPAMVACRVLESRTDGSAIEKAQTFIDAYNAAGVTPHTDDAQLIVDSGQVYLMHPGLSQEANLYSAWAWAYCGAYSDGSWRHTSGAEDMKRSGDVPCAEGGADNGGSILGGTLEATSNDDGPLGAANQMVNSASTNVHNFSEGESDVEDRVGTNPESQALREWSYSYLGGNWGQRILSGIIALLTAGLYTWSFGPAALGLVIAGVGMILLAILAPLSLVLWGMGREAGKRMLALTGGTAMATFLFTLVLSFLAAIVSVLTNFVLAMFPNSGATMGRQLLLAALPVVALFLIRWALRKMDLPNLTSLAGSLGLASGIAAKAAGDQKLTGTTTALGDKFSRRGMKGGGTRQRDPHSTQRSLADRFRNNAVARKIGSSKLGAAAKQMGSAAKDTVGHMKDVAGDNLSRIPGAQKAKAAGAALAKTKSGRLAGGALALGAISGAAGPAALLGLGAAGMAAAGGEFGLGKLIDGKLNPARLSASAARRRANRIAKDMSPAEIAALSPGYSRDQLAGVVSTHDAKKAEKSASRFRQYVARIDDPKERDEILSNYTTGALNRVRAVQNGAESPNGVNATFSGFESMLAQADAQNIIAQKMGVEPAGVVISSHGLSAPAAVTLAANGAPKLPATATLATAGHPIHYLDADTVMRRDQEDDDEYLTRIHASMLARGLMDGEGRVVDVFATKGIDTNTVEGAARVEAWLAGGVDEELADMKFRPAKGEHKLVTKALNWSAQESGDMYARQWEQVQQAAALQDEVTSTLREPDAIHVRLDRDPESGKDRVLTLGDIDQRLTTDLSKMEETLRSAKSPEEAALALNSLGDVELLAGHFVDGLEASAMARASAEVQEFSMLRRGEVDGRELRNLSQGAVTAAAGDSKRRRQAVDKATSELSRLGVSMRNGSEESRVTAMRNAQEVVQRLNTDLVASRMAEMEASREAYAAFEEARQKEIELQEAEAAAGYVRHSPRHRPTSSKELVKSRGQSRRSQVTGHGV